MNNKAPLTINHIQEMKRQGEKIAMLTCYDAAFARAMDEAGVDIILVGDSMGMVVQGMNSTVAVSVDDIAYHTRCVARGVERTFLLADMPFGSYHNESSAMNNAVQLLSAGSAMVKLEGAGPMIAIVEYLVSRGVPVCGHLGLTPQSVHQLGGFKVQAREAEAPANWWRMPWPCKWPAPRCWCWSVCRQRSAVRFLRSWIFRSSG